MHIAFLKTSTKIIVAKLFLSSFQFYFFLHQTLPSKVFDSRLLGIYPISAAELLFTKRKTILIDQGRQQLCSKKHVLKSLHINGLKPVFSSPTFYAMY